MQKGEEWSHIHFFGGGEISKQMCVCVCIYIYNPQVLSQKVTQEITMSFSILNYFNSFGIL